MSKDHMESKKTIRARFPNGKVFELDQKGFFEAVAEFSKVELSAYDMNDPQGKPDFEWDLCNRATGTPQVIHRTVTRIGELSDGRNFFLLRGSAFAIPYDILDVEAPSIAQLMGDPGVSYWLKDSLRSALERDPVDAMKDAELLAQVLAHRALMQLS
ncbi:hypothetical protein D9M73_87940 [compost metagenome]